MKDFPVIIQPHPRSRSLRMKFCPYRCHFILTTPLRVRERDVADFLAKSKGWMGCQFQKHQGNPQITLGDHLSILGDSYILSHDPLRKKGVFETERVLWVGGKDVTDLESLLMPWFKKKAQGFFKDLAQDYASRLGVSFDRVSVKDTISRWGSCSAKGTLSFNWRLLLAPPSVADYVVAHEVSHIVHMNHSDKFWKVVETLCPTYRIHRLWLKRHGGTLYSQFPLRTS